jgi:predicted dehydrogenase
MSQRPLRTVVIGFGKVSRGYAEDAAMARHYPYATHAQVLAANARFDWLGVVDPSPDACEQARLRWCVPNVADRIENLGEIAEQVEVAVLATPPQSRLGLLDRLPRLRAVVVEKPLGHTLAESTAFVKCCQERGVLVQVNLWRRADEQFRALAAGALRNLIGSPTLVTGYYGNGLLNNGVHLVDFLRMLFGEIRSVASLADRPAFAEGPIQGDSNPAFELCFVSGVAAQVHALRFAAYREVGFDAWGDSGRFSVLNEGLTLLHYERLPNRAMSGEWEIACDMPRPLRTTVGHALYRLFDNVADALFGNVPLYSPASSALRTTSVIEAIALACRQRRSVSFDGGDLQPVP